MNNSQKFRTVRIKDQEYRFNNIIFLVAMMLLAIVSALSVFAYNNMEYKYYVECNEEKCFNGYYHSKACGDTLPNNRPICTQEYFFRGDTDGTRQPIILQYLWHVIISIILLSFIINHLLYNRNFSFKGGINVNE